LSPSKVYGDGLPCQAIVADDGWTYEYVRSPHRTYIHEFFPSVQGFLFSQTGAPGSFACWQIEPRCARPWFEKTRVAIDSAGGVSARVSLRQNSGIEVFLSDLGVGLLSLSLRLIEIPDVVWMRQLVHNLATAEDPAHRRRFPVTFSRPSRVLNVEKIPPEKLALVSQPPHRHDDLRERLVREGGVYDWNELRAYLLAPLTKAFGAQSTHQRAWCHVVLQLAETHDFQEAENRRAVKHLLSALAQLHPQSHPGEVAGRTHARSFTVNRTHMAAVSITGAAHAVAQQPSHQYDELRLLRAHNSYFVPYVLANLQRLVLQRFLDAAQKGLCAPSTAPLAPAPGTNVGTGMTAAPGESAPGVTTAGPTLLELWRAVVRFGLTSEQLEISPRSTLQRYYRVSCDASAVPNAVAQLRAVIAEWDGIERAERLYETAQHMRRNVESLERLQGEVGWVEVVIISVYVVQLAQIIGQGFGFAGSWWHGISLLILSILALALARVCGFYPGRHKRESRWQKLVFMGVFVLIGVYVIANYLIHTATHKTPSSAQPSTAAKEPPPAALPVPGVPEQAAQH
jgi:hypothetical protein